MAVTVSLPRPSKGKGTPPVPAETHANLDKPATGQKVPLQLKISPELRRDFKMYALERDQDASELFAQVWAFYLQRHG